MKWHTFQPQNSEQDSPAGTNTIQQGSPAQEGVQKVATVGDEKLAVGEEKPTRPLLTTVHSDDAQATQENGGAGTADALDAEGEAEQMLELKARQVKPSEIS